MEVILSKSTRTIAAPALIQSWVSSCFASNSNSNFSLRISHIPFIKDGFRTREEFELLHYSLHGIFGSQRPTLIVVHPTKIFLHFISFLSQLPFSELTVTNFLEMSHYHLIIQQEIEINHANTWTLHKRPIEDAGLLKLMLRIRNKRLLLILYHVLCLEALKVWASGSSTSIPHSDNVININYCFRRVDMQL